MKKYAIYLFSIVAAFTVMSCENIDDVQNLSLSCKTNGFVEGNQQTEALWSADEKIYLFRAEDWQSSLFSISAGADSSNATFSGSFVGTNRGYYAVRPASAAGAVLPNGDMQLTVEPQNIFLEGENSSVVTPQIGIGSKGGLTFDSIFGAIKFEVSGVEECPAIEFNIPNKEHSLYGTLTYNLLQSTITDEDKQYSVLRSFTEPFNLTTKQNIYVALPAGEYDEVELLVRNSKNGRMMLYTAKSTMVETGKIASPSVSAVEMPCLVGGWRIKSVGDTAVVADIYIDFGRKGNFTIYQRIDALTYTTYEGTYSVNEEESVVSGIYSDGSAWLDSYRFYLNDAGNLVLESVTNPSDIAEYESSDMPTSATTKSLSRTGANSVKPL